MPTTGNGQEGFIWVFCWINDDNQLLALFENYEISKLDINRIYRYLDKYTKENAADTEDKEIDIDEVEWLNHK